MGPWKPGDFGISGDRTQNVLYRIENGEFEGVTPKVIVLLIGTNNLAANATYGMNTVEDTVKGLRRWCGGVAQGQGTGSKRILLIGIMSAEWLTKGGPDIWEKICKTNEQIAKLDDGKTVKYLNINDKLADKDGKLLPGVMGADNFCILRRRGA